MATAALDADFLIAEAKHRARRRYLLIAGGLAAVGAIGAMFATQGSERARPAAIAAPTCRPAQLRAEKPRFEGVFTGHVVESLSFRNASAGSCSLAGWPSLVAVLPNGRHVVARVGHIRNVAARSNVVVPPHWIDLRPGGRASFHLIADGGTGLDGICPSPLPSVTALVVPPGASAPARGTTAIPYCPGLGNPPVALSPVVPGPRDPYVF